MAAEPVVWAVRRGWDGSEADLQRVVQVVALVGAWASEWVEQGVGLLAVALVPFLMFQVLRVLLVYLVGCLGFLAAFHLVRWRFPARF